MDAASTGEPSNAGARPAGPYVGLVPFDENDAAFFFGRSTEIAIVAANLRANRLTILYGPSGVGKSSLLMAGVVHRLREEAASAGAGASFPVCVYRQWPGDPESGLREAIGAALGAAAAAGDDPPPGSTLADLLRARTGPERRLLLVLDQFEEYFQYHAGENAEETLTGFAAELAGIVNDPTVPANILLSVREDAWAKLDLFEGHIPALFNNYVRVDHLDRAAAREAIEEPIAAWNRTLPADAAPYSIQRDLTDGVLDATAAGSLTLTADGEAPAPGTASDKRIEAPFLQLVLDRIWRATVADRAHVLTLATLEALGGARKIVEDHLLDALARLAPAERDVASDCFRFLVSSDRTKIARPAADLAEWTQRPEPQVTAVLDRLCSGESGRILREVAPTRDGGSSSYELFHDILGQPILDWRRNHEQERARRQARRRYVRVAGVLFSLVAVFAALGIYAWIEKSHANHLLHEQQVISTNLTKDVGSLQSAKSALTKRLQNVPAASAAQVAEVKSLTETNSRLTAANSRLERTSRALGPEIHTLRLKNSERVAAIRRLNTENAGLATEINELHAEFERLNTELGSLSSNHDDLVADAGILHVQAASLSVQLQALQGRSAELERKATELGLPPQVAAATSPTSSAFRPPYTPVVAVPIPIPTALALSDSLRRQLTQLAQELTKLLEQRAGLAGEAVWLRKDNALLVRQRDVLRAEIEQLRRTKARLASRNRELQKLVTKAEAKHAVLSRQAAKGEKRNGTLGNAVAAQRHANTRLQGANNQRVTAIGGTQSQIRTVRAENRFLVGFIAPKVDKLLRAVQDSSVSPSLAGLLAVAGYLVTPFAPDNALHPGVYNALWIALSRLDKTEARNLIAPTGNLPGKIGTTRSNLLVQRICGLLTRGFSRAEWRRFLPPHAPFKTPLSRPCA